MATKIVETKAEQLAREAHELMVKETQEKCPHVPQDQILSKAGWRCTHCGKISEEISYNELEAILSKTKKGVKDGEE
jgi:transposase-like protein